MTPADRVSLALQTRATVFIVANGTQLDRASRVTVALAAAGGDVRAMGADTTTLTAVANDYGFEHAYARQLDGLVRQGDVLLVLRAAAADEPNLDRAVRAAVRRGADHVELTTEREVAALVSALRAHRRRPPAHTERDVRRGS